MPVLARFLTDFADQAVMLPAVALTALATAGWWRRGAAAWAAGVGIGFGGILFLKLALGACGERLAPIAPNNPSGHAMAATFVAGGAVALLGGRARMSTGGALLAGAAVGWSRLVLRAHLPGEVAVGIGVGLLALATFRRLAGPRPTADRKGERRRGLLVLAALAAPACLLHSHRLPAESAIRRWAVTVVRPALGCGAPPTGSTDR